MQIDERTDQFLHSKLPIDADENIIAVYKHHWFAYVSGWIIAFFMVIVVMGLAAVLTSLGGENGPLVAHRNEVIAVAGVLSVLILMGAALPAYLRSLEALVLTDEALLQVLQPSLFANKIDQLNLQRIDDVTVRQDFLGTLFGYGHLTVETPGEQDNYEFYMIPRAHEAARKISETRENYEAAMQSGRMPTTMGQPQPQLVPGIDPQQYQEFLQYQQMVAQQKRDTAQAQQPQPPEGQNQPPQSQE